MIFSVEGKLAMVATIMDLEGLVMSVWMEVVL